MPEYKAIFTAEEKARRAAESGLAQSRAKTRLANEHREEYHQYYQEELTKLRTPVPKKRSRGNAQGK